VYDMDQPRVEPGAIWGIDELIAHAAYHGYSFETLDEAADILAGDARDGDHYWIERGPGPLLQSVVKMNAAEIKQRQYVRKH
jgi:hypothetical protein